MGTGFSPAAATGGYSPVVVRGLLLQSMGLGHRRVSAVAAPRL